MSIELIKAALAIILGFSLYMLFSHPKYLKKSVPSIGTGKIQILPNLKIKFKNRIIHLHHWILLSAFLGFLNHIAQGIDNLFYIKLFTLGGIIQGFSFKDRFKVFIKKQKIKYKFPSISVVIPAFNEEKLLPQTLESLKKQDYRGKFEIIIVDNASSDKTAEIARKFGAKVVFEPRKGLPFARQAGFDKASGEFIASTDADIIVPKNWLSRLAAKLVSDPKMVAVSGWFKLSKGPLIPRFAINHLSQSAIFIYSLIFRKKLLLDPNYMVRKTAFVDCGGYKNLPAMMEDLQLAQRLTTIGDVKMCYGSDWLVVSSPRRWRSGLIAGAWPYVINALSFAIFGKVLSSNLTDIRNEEPQKINLRTRFAYTLGILIIAFTFLSVPISPTHAKVMPITKRVETTITRTVSNTPNFVRKQFRRYHSRHPFKLNV